MTKVCAEYLTTSINHLIQKIERCDRTSLVWPTQKNVNSNRVHRCTGKNPDTYEVPLIKTQDSILNVFKHLKSIETKDTRDKKTLVQIIQLLEQSKIETPANNILNTANSLDCTNNKEAASVENKKISILNAADPYEQICPCIYKCRKDCVKTEFREAIPYCLWEKYTDSTKKRISDLKPNQEKQNNSQVHNDVVTPKQEIPKNYLHNKCCPYYKNGKCLFQTKSPKYQTIKQEIQKPTFEVSPRPEASKVTTTEQKKVALTEITNNLIYKINTILPPVQGAHKKKGKIKRKSQTHSGKKETPQILVSSSKSTLSVSKEVQHKRHEKKSLESIGSPSISSLSFMKEVHRQVYKKEVFHPDKTDSRKKPKKSKLSQNEQTPTQLHRKENFGSYSSSLSAMENVVSSSILAKSSLSFLSDFTQTNSNDNIPEHSLSVHKPMLINEEPKTLEKVQSTPELSTSKPSCTICKHLQQNQDCKKGDSLIAEMKRQQKLLDLKMYIRKKQILCEIKRNANDPRSVIEPNYILKQCCDTLDYCNQIIEKTVAKRKKLVPCTDICCKNKTLCVYD